MVKLIKSLAKSVKHGLKNGPEIQRLKNKHPKFFHFIKKRLNSNEKYGLHFTIGIIFTLIFIYIFFGILQDYIGQENLVQFDLRVINLFATFRYPQLNQQMLFITYLAKGEVIVVGLIVFSLIFYIYKKWRFLYTLLISVGVGELFVWIIKNIVERPRPPLTDALVAESSYSFPSGHTFVAIAFYGLLSYFIIQSEKHKSLKIISFIFCLILICSIGISRVYLGAHWPSDVFASLAVGAAWLTILITSFKIRKKFTPPKSVQFNFRPQIAKIITIILILVWVGFIISFYLTHPLKSPIPSTKNQIVLQTDQIEEKLFATLPKISESISSLPAEPINIIIVATKDSIDQAFTNSGWYLLDQPSLKSYTQIIISFFQKKSYPQTPGLPVFWDTQPNKIGYGQPVDQTFTGARHHIHLWQTDFVDSQGVPIWVGTAHYDNSIKTLKFGLVLPFHTTEVMVDQEREYIKSELENNDFVLSSEKVDLTGLLYGTKKGSGNSFLTDGQAYILFLKP